MGLLYMEQAQVTPLATYDAITSQQAIIMWQAD